MNELCIEIIVICLNIFWMEIIQFVVSSNPFLLPLYFLATGMFISSCARGMENWEKAVDLYFSSLLGSVGKKHHVNETKVKGRNPRWAS